MNRIPTLVMIPCFAGAPWDLSQMKHLQQLPMRTLRLPDNLDDLEALADFIEDQIKDLDSYVLVGDSFGAVLSIVLAIRRPPGLLALVLSGGFAKNPITSPLLKTLAMLAPLFPGEPYRQLTLRVHAANLRSAFDLDGEIPWSTKQTRAFFARETPHRAYLNRIRAIEHADYTDQLGRIAVPTLILTPEEDRLIGKQAAETLLNGIAQATEVVLPKTGHMFRFSHPAAYSHQIRIFLEAVLEQPVMT